ncbi:MAG TPA: cupin domain-containing protein [Kouleothrix sp.]|uniref:cupin domain-containing protein n=1 Tax=Kouleothrix sp. TaxID=2779161 RepID=UPI002BBEC099|nr:cupin domain-containing protein [Kouleothrix sp.]HRC77126.1 cupin domain-containing protein [Kouleothrix sp.]
MEAFAIDDLLAQQGQGGRAYLEFLRVPAMSAGLYVLPAGASDPQQPHSEDELYYIVRGRGQIFVAGASQPVGPGSLVYVKAHDEHRFHDIAEELAILVFFAPAEYSNAPAQ